MYCKRKSSKAKLGFLFCLKVNMNILVNGALGKMGQTVCAEATKAGHTVIGVDRGGFVTASDMDLVDGIIDFSAPAALDGILAVAVENNLPIVIATTGYSREQISKIKWAAKKIPVCLTANTSKGINILNKLSCFIYKEYGDCDVEIIEYHHKNKVDSPSGTAKALADNLKKVKGGRVVSARRSKKARAAGEIGIASVRGGNEIGTHEIIFYCGDEVITVKHQATNRRLFALGAIWQLEKLKGKSKGLYKEV